jgi:hypothetical protein
MAHVVITRSLEEEINKHFKHESVKVLKFLKTVEEFPKKGKTVGSIGGVVIKELKYRNVYRFYFITDAHKVKFLQSEELKELLIKFVRMSHKRDQQQVIDAIKNILRSLGEEGFL